MKNNYFAAHDMLMASIHEAGHVICGLLHFININSANIYATKKSTFGGLTYYESIPIDEISDSTLRNKIIISEIKFNYAGLTAEKHHFEIISGSKHFPIFWKNGSSDDTLCAASLLKKYNLAPPGKQRFYLKQKLIKKTYRDIFNYWSDVTLVAQSLFKKQKLGNIALKNILTKKSKNKYFWKEQFKNIDYIYKNIEDIDEKMLKTILFS